ncbi:aldolase/citrate lyase/malate synthase family protein [Anaeromyxobacter paludicola]|uniref:malate synthase n=1 Tax=Anaeromyxobacter paludicola TaxID=2918171 RepID=A0ABM7XAF2_9BACT|nr:malate synthase [Anaeromyxobacter paludicola]BDG08830.1 malate synthase [Anaeromyxobacter paludicola]
MVRADILQQFPELFGTRQVNGRQVNVEETIAALTRELRPAIAEALNARRELLAENVPVTRKYAWAGWDETFEDPAGGKPWTFRQIVQGMLDNAAGRESPWRWRLNDEVPIPEHVHPSRNPGLELTGPWHPLDMAFNALNSPAPMNMPDFEDASPSHFTPEGAAAGEPVGVFAALRNAREIFEGKWNDRPYEVEKKGKTRQYRISKPPARWPTRLARPPSLHVLYEHVQVDGAPAPGLVVVATLWALGNFDALRRSGSGVYFYIPKLQSPREALVVERLLSRLEETLGVPAGTLKAKMLYEEGNAGRVLPAIVWTLRRRLLGTNVGRWDYLGSLIEMWKDDPEGVFPDPQSIGMATPNMIAYQRYNAQLMLMAGMKDGALSNGAPIGGMAAVMIYQPSDPYGRSRYNPLALRAMAIDKLRERILGLQLVPEGPLPGAAPTLAGILAGEAKGTLHDAYRQSWVASPEPEYVAAGNAPLRAPIGELQALLDAPRQTVEVAGKPVPTVASGLSDAERSLLQSRGLLDAEGRITPAVIRPEALASPEAFLTPELWSAIYRVPKGDVTIAHVQHAFYMAANYGFQILNGNFAAAIDDYELKLRFMNDLATYRINVSWLWTLVRHEARITRDGHLLRQALTEDGVVLAAPAEEVKAGSRFTRALFDKVFAYHDEWTAAFFAEQDRKGAAGRFDRSKAPVIMELLKRQLLSPRYIQHSARVLFVVGEAPAAEREPILEAVFDLGREELLAKVRAGERTERLLKLRDYVYDVCL